MTYIHVHVCTLVVSMVVMSWSRTSLSSAPVSSTWSPENGANCNSQSLITLAKLQGLTRKTVFHYVVIYVHVYVCIYVLAYSELFNPIHSVVWKFSEVCVKCPCNIFLQKTFLTVTDILPLTTEYKILPHWKITLPTIPVYGSTLQYTCRYPVEFHSTKGGGNSTLKVHFTFTLQNLFYSLTVFFFNYR